MSESRPSDSPHPENRKPARQRPARPEGSVPESASRAIPSARALERLIQGQEKPDLKQIQTVVGKLQTVIADYLDSGKPLQIALSAFEVLSALEAAIQEADGRPSPWPDGADARTFFIHGLYDEIIQQPSNIFETRLFPDGSERYVPVSRATWKACLQRLHEQIIASGTKLGQRKKRGE
ncbi:MAG TPA: hypothetical protein DCP71_07920 [Verrucomicrobiales bacterium]|nr:hypothetical protein [Verrucomicrobiales bacterium]